MESLIYDMRCSVLTIARGDKQKAKRNLQRFLQRAQSTLQGDELEEFLRDVMVLEQDIKYLAS
jgi:hypothetical protein